MTFVLPIVEYASQIWSPSFEYQIVNIESIQKQFLLYALRKFKWKDRLRLPSYKHRLLLLDMNSLYDRRIIARVSFIHSLLIGSISSPTLLTELSLRIPLRITRNTGNSLLYINNFNNPLNTMCKYYNEFSYIIDFNQSNEIVKTTLKNHFKRTV